MPNIGGKLNAKGTFIDTNDDGIVDGFAHTIRNAGNFTTFSLAAGVLSVQPASAGATAAGADTQVQFRDGTAFGGDSGLVFNKTTNLLTAGAITVTGNLTVNGTTTTVNSTTVTIDDPIFTLGGDTAPGSDDNKDRGIEFRYHNGSDAKVGFMGWDDSAGRVVFASDVTNSSEVMTLTTKSDVEGAKFYAAGSNAVYTFASDPNTGLQHVAADALGLYTGGATRAYINATGVHINPAGAGAASTHALEVTGAVKATTDFYVGANYKLTSGSIYQNVGAGAATVLALQAEDADNTDDVTIHVSGLAAYDATNHEKLSLGFTASDNTYRLTSSKGGTGTVRDFNIYSAGTLSLAVAGDDGNVGIKTANPTSVLHVTGDANVSTNLTVGGTLTVSGSTTTLNTTNSYVSDKFMTLNNGESGNGVTGNTAGIEVDRGDNGSPNPLTRFVFDDSDDSWKPVMESGSGSGSYAVSALKGSTITGTTLTDGTFTTTGGTTSTTNATITGTLDVAADIVHTGDTDTKVTFTTNDVTLTAGAVEGLSTNATELVINDGSADFDFRIESNDAANMFFVDGTNNKIGINVDNTVTAPSAFLDLQAQAASATGLTDFIEITNSKNASSMTGTGAGVLFNQFYYDGSTPAVVDAARIGVQTTGNWTSTAATQDAKMTLGVVANGTMVDAVTLTGTDSGTGNNTAAFTGDVSVAGDLTVTGTTITADVETVSTSNGVIFEGSAADAHELLLKAGTLDGDRTITLPNVTGTAITTANSDAPTTTTSSGDADFVLVDDAGVMKKITPGNLGIGGGGSVSETFKTIVVSGQSDVVADGATDTLTLVGGANIAITTNAGTDTVTFTGTASSATVNTETVGTDATHYLTFVNSDNGSSTAETVYTDAGITYNPSSNVLGCGALVASSAFTHTDLDSWQAGNANGYNTPAYWGDGVMGGLIGLAHAAGMDPGIATLFADPRPTSLDQAVARIAAAVCTLLRTPIPPSL